MHVRSQQRKLLELKLILALHGCNDPIQLKQVHGHLFRKGLDQSCFVLSKLIQMLTKLGVPMEPYPNLLFKQVNRRNPFLWNALIRGYTSQGPISKPIILYNRMRMEGTSPVSFTFSALIKACTDTLNDKIGTQLHGQAMFLGGFSSDLYVGNTLIDMYVKCGHLDRARLVFDEMFKTDLISWTSLIVAHAKKGDVDAAIGFFDGLPEKDTTAWTAMITCLVQNAMPMEALDFFQRMQDSGVETDHVTLVSAISACAQLGSSKYGGWVRNVAEQSGFGPNENVIVGSALIDMYSKCGSAEKAYKIFRSMRERNVFSYSSMILGFAIHGCATEALDLFNEMTKETDIKPNEVTFIGVLTACSHAGRIEDGRHVFATMEECYGVVPSSEHYTCMVDLFGRAGRLEEALELVNLMSREPCSSVWGALLGACRIHGNSNIAEIAALRLFEIEPYDIGNYVLLSNIYASTGKWDDVLRVRKMMRVKGLKKKPSCSWMEVKGGEIHRFFVGDISHPRCVDIRLALEDLLESLKIRGYQANLSSVVHNVSDEEKLRLLMGHSEKLALAFGLLCTDVGSEIMIVKNVRICEDCHLFMCDASAVTKREIIVRDNLRFHHFVNGKCSCGNFW